MRISFWAAFVLTVATMGVLSGSALASTLLFVTSKAEELFTLKQESGKERFVLETSAKNQVVCERALGHGYLHNNEAFATKIELTFHGCSLESTVCASTGQPEGLIVTKELEGTLATLVSNGKVGLLLAPESGTTVAEFECESGKTQIAVSGNVLTEYTESLKHSQTEFTFKLAKGTDDGEPMQKQYEGPSGKGTAKLTTTATGVLKFTSLESSLEGTAKTAIENAGEIMVEEGGLFSTVNAKELLSVNTTNETALLTLSGTEVKCEVTLAHGYALNKTDLADEVLFTFHKCTSLVGSCQSTGEPSGLIKTKDLMGLLVTLSNGKFGIKLEAEKAGETLATFECGGLITVEVNGSVVGEFSKAENKVAFKETEVVFASKAGEKGMPLWPTYSTLEGTGTAKLTSIIKGLINETSESSEDGKGNLVLAAEGSL